MRTASTSVTPAGWLTRLSGEPPGHQQGGEDDGLERRPALSCCHCDAVASLGWGWKEATANSRSQILILLTCNGVSGC